MEIIETSREDLNSKTGSVVGFDYDKGRYHVSLPATSQADETSVMLRPRNVREVDTKTEVPATPRPLAILQGFHPPITTIAEMLGVRYKDMKTLRRKRNELAAL